MDTSVAEIIFDSHGVCNFCRAVSDKINTSWFPNRDGANRIARTLEVVRTQGVKGFKKFDSILGLSGGLDSAVVARRVMSAGLRPLAVHVDGGWNTEASVQNVNQLVRELDLELETVVIDWEEMRNLQLAFLKSGTLNQDIPQDHAFFASLYHTAIQRKIPVILSGINYATESVQPASWGYSNSDGSHIRSVNSAHGRTRLKGFPIMTLRKFSRLTSRNHFQVVRPLDYGIYDPEIERVELEKKYGWRAYGEKHSESLFTNWFQAVYLPERYGIDKRRGDWSSKIIADLATRDDAIRQLSSPPVDEQGRRDLNRSVAEKLQVSVSELQQLAEIPHLSNHAFKTKLKSWFSP